MRFAELQLGMTAASTKEIGQRDIALFGELTGDRNPLHFDQDFAEQSRFEGIISHGMLTAGLLSTVLGMKLPGTGAVYVSQSLNFVAPVRPGDTITASAEVVELVPERRRVRLTTRIANQRDETVIEGEAWMFMME
ncbi:MAG: MaoC family dehydratase [Gemmatimonadales bacterium]